MNFETYSVAYEGRRRYGKYMTNSKNSSSSSVAGEGGSTGGGSITALETFSGDSAGTWTIPDNYIEPSEGNILKVRISTPCYSGASSADTVINTLQLGDGEPYIVWFSYGVPLTDEINIYDEIDLTFREDAGSITLEEDTGALSAGTYTDGWVMESAHDGIWIKSGNTAYTRHNVVGYQEVCAFGSGTSYEGISVIDNLSSTSSVDALSANQGRLLDESKQDTLESGVNIKTINNQSILGSGNIDIQGGTGSSYTAGSNIDISNNVISVTGITSFTGITNQDVLDALGYTPYNSTNPSGYITAASLPTKVSDLQNDAGYITSAALPEQYWSKTGNTIGTQYNVVGMQEVCAFGSGTSADGISVIDNLNSSSSVDALSANQGRILKDYVDNHTVSSLTWTSIENTPTTLQGYGITDAFTSGQTDNRYLRKDIGGIVSGYTQFKAGIGLDNNQAIYLSDSGGTGIDLMRLGSDNSMTIGYGNLEVTPAYPVFIDGSHLYLRTSTGGGVHTLAVDINQFQDALFYGNITSQKEISCFGAGTGNTIIEDLYAEIQALKQRVTDLENAQI